MRLIKKTPLEQNAIHGPDKSSFIKSYVRKFNIGDIVFWGGHAPCIGKIKNWYGDGVIINGRLWPVCYVIDKKHNHLSENHLRLATKEEIKLLGRKNKIVLSESFITH